MAISSLVKQILEKRCKRTPIIIGIGGPAGVGKTTLATNLARDLSTLGLGVQVMGCDDFIRSTEERKNLGEWSPDHVRLDEIKRVLDLIRAGERTINSQRYLRGRERKLVDWQIMLERVDILIFEGLYAINSSESLGNFLQFIDLAVYMTAPIDKIKEWRFAQEKGKKAGRNDVEMEKHWQEGILPDTVQNVMPTESNADILLEVGAAHELKLIWPEGKAKNLG